MKQSADRINAMARKPRIVAQPRRKYWRGHVAMYRNSVSSSIGLPNGERRCVVLPTARFWSRERREARDEILAHLHLPGTKVPRPSAHYHWLTVSLPLILAEVDGRLWRSRQPVRRYPARPIRGRRRAPHNVLIRRVDGTRVVRPFRRLRRFVDASDIAETA